MSLVGAAAIAIWNDVARPSRQDFREWHSREHAPERIGIPGFLRARRYVSTLDEAPDRFFMLYELDSINALDSSEYTFRLNNPTAWTRQMSGTFSNSSRALCKVEFTRGIGQGGLIETLSYDLPAGSAEEHYRWLAHSALPALSDQIGVTGAHLCRTDMRKAAVVSREKEGRTISAPNWVVLIEGCGQADELTAASAGLRNALENACTPGSMSASMFRLEYARGKFASG
jgi:hypothetical protein